MYVYMKYNNNNNICLIGSFWSISNVIKYIETNTLITFTIKYIIGIYMFTFKQSKFRIYLIMTWHYNKHWKRLI